MRPGRVLIADADPRFRSQLYTRLLDVSLFSDAVSNATDGFELLRDRSYVLVILDLDLPNGEAFALLDRLRRLPAGDRPMVLATASPQTNGAVDADLVQIILRKPLRLADIADIIRACIDSRDDTMSRRAQRPNGRLELASGDENPVRIER